MDNSMAQWMADWRAMTRPMAMKWADMMAPLMVAQLATLMVGRSAPSLAVK